LVSLRTLPTKGVYTLIIFLNKELSIKVHKLGSFTFPKGYYAYTGSAVGNGAVNLRRRVKRHLKNRKVKHWHIDFLLSNTNATIVAIVAAESGVNRECQANNAIRNLEGATVPVIGFGSSDCKQNCKSHLVHFSEEKPKEKIVHAYADLFGMNVTSFLWRDKKCR